MLTPNEEVARVRVDNAGRIVIPSDLRSRLHIEPGDELIVSTGENSLEIRTFHQVVRQAQAIFAPYKTPGHSVVDELLADRRAEAAGESDD